MDDVERSVSVLVLRLGLGLGCPPFIVANCIYYRNDGLSSVPEIRAYTRAAQLLFQSTCFLSRTEADFVCFHSHFHRRFSTFLVLGILAPKQQ
jgi:hypothetical protein